jgi:putative alpha-1,2-mannosidase
MYPVIPGTDVLVIHGPQFPSIVVHLANGHTWNIQGEGAGMSGAHYIQRGFRARQHG